MKKFEFTEEDRNELLKLLSSRSYLGVRNYLSQLKEIKEEKDE